MSPVGVLDQEGETLSVGLRLVLWLGLTESETDLDRDIDGEELTLKLRVTLEVGLPVSAGVLVTLKL